MWTFLMTTAMLIGVLIFAAQLQLARRIARAKTDVPIFNQIFVLCLVFSGRLFFLANQEKLCVICILCPSRSDTIRNSDNDIATAQYVDHVS